MYEMISVRSKQHGLTKVKVIASSIGVLVAFFIFVSEYQNIIQNSSRYLASEFSIVVALVFSVIVGISVAIVIGFLLKQKDR